MRISGKQLVANRKNAKLGGVKTEAGKQAIRQNAVTHGLLAKDVLVRGESAELYEQLRTNLYAECAPSGEMETFLVGIIASCMWRWTRAIKVDHGDRIILANDVNSVTSSQSFSRYETMIERKLYRAMHELERLQRKRLGEDVPPPLAINMDLSRPD
jgi:hypothetical protein